MKDHKLITIVSYFDDNFGDMLIKNSFECLLKTALDNLDISDYETRRMPLKRINVELLKKSNLICFAGGGLLGLSYLDFFDYVREIVEIAEDNGVPVIFSSVGINNMDYEEGDDKELKKLLSHRCIKAISVREQLEWFRKYSEGNSFSVEQVCDPAMWSKHIFRNSISDIGSSKTLVGINCVRGKLLRANGYGWTQKDQFDYLDKMIEIIENNGYKFILYTNGSVGDNLTLRTYAESRNIAEENVVMVHSSEQLVETISRCGFICAIRLHSAIIASALGIPVANVVWNDKVPCFYSAVGHPERAFSTEDMDYKKYEGILKDTIGTIANPEEGYLMSLYRYIFTNVGQIFNADSTSKMYDFSEVSERIAEKYEESRLVYELEDYEFKLDKAERNAFRYKSSSANNKKLATKLEKENKELKCELQEIKKMPAVRAVLKIKRASIKH